MATQQTAIGIQQGSLNVSPDGTARYNFPIDLPPGINGLSPLLGLMYDSSQAEGSLGMGWSLSGISLISRVAANMATDGFTGSINFDGNDRFSLDGKRLINISENNYGDPDAAYYTEINEWTRVLPSHNGFIACMKNGKQYAYGTEPDSNSLFSSDAGNNIRSWALNTITDAYGNSINFKYTQDPLASSQDPSSGLTPNENFYLQEISYSGFTVEFGYILRDTSPLVQYTAGQKIVTSCILREIRVMMGTELIARYTCTYEVSKASRKMRMTQITRFDGAGNSLPPVSMTWQDPTPALVPSDSNIQTSEQIVDTVAVDINGDGITDIIRFYDDGSGNLKADCLIASYNADSDTLTYSSPIDSAIYFPDYSGQQYRILLAEIRESGITDVLIAFSDSQGNLDFQPFWSNGDGTFTQANMVSTGTPFTNIGLFSIDANGDGITDVVQAYWDANNKLFFQVYIGQDILSCATNRTNLNSTTVNTGFQLNNESAGNYQLFPIDVNADKLTDMVLAYEDSGDLALTSFITSSSTDGFTYFSYDPDTNPPMPDPIPYPGNGNIIPADANGDGVIDLIVLQKGTENTTVSTSTFLSDLTGNFVFANTSYIPEPIGNWGDISFFPMGFNGGSQTCILCGVNNMAAGQNNYSFFVLGSMSDGSFSYLAQVTGPQNLNNTATFNVGDPKGTGKAGFFMSYTNQDNIFNISPYCSSGPYPDLINTITDMMGNVTTISYLPITDSTVYTETAEGSIQYPRSSARRYPCHLSPSQYPIQRVLGEALYVVSGYTISNTNVIDSLSYHKQYLFNYTDACIDLSGRGWEGFRTVCKTDLSTGLAKTSTYAQGFPFTGMLYSETTQGISKYSSDPNMPPGKDSALLRISAHLYKSTGNGTVHNMYYQVDKAYDLVSMYVYGQFDYTLATQFACDIYGNPVLKTWHGEVAGLDLSQSNFDPDNNPPGTYPSLTPVAPDEVVYTHRQYLNTTSSDCWVLGLKQAEKVSMNAAPPTNFDSFVSGDLTLLTNTYGVSSNNSYTLNLIARSVYDNVNDAYLTTGYDYDSHGNVTLISKPGGEFTSYTYDTSNTYPIKSVISDIAPGQGTPANDATTFTTYADHDPRFGRKVACQDENGSVYICGLDGFGRKVCEQGPVPEGCSQSDDVSQLCTVGAIDLSNVKVLTLEETSYAKDGQGSIFLTQSFLQSFPTSSARDMVGRTTYLDALGRHCIEVQDMGNADSYAIVITQFAPCGKPSYRSLPFFGTGPDSIPTGGCKQYTYDILGRPLNEQLLDEAKKQLLVRNYAYGSGNEVTVTEGSSTPYIQKVTSHFFNGKHRHIQSVIPGDNNATTTLKYDAIGRLLSTTDPAGICNTITYDSLDRKLTYDNPDQNTTGDANKTARTYSYDKTTGNLQNMIDAIGDVTTYTYDNFSRMLSQSFSDGRNFTFTFDKSTNGIGKLSNVQLTSIDDGPTFDKTFNYDNYGNQAGYELSIANKGITRSFSISSVFDPLKRLVAKTLPDNAVHNAVYANGLLASQTLGDVSVSYTGYNASGSVTNMQCGVGGSPVLYTEYNYDAGGVRSGEMMASNAALTDPLLNFSFVYNDLYLLSTVQEAVHNATGSFGYTNKKLTSASIPGSGDTTSVYSYDGAGNILAKDGYQFTYDGSHFPKTALLGGHPITLAQDGCGRVTSRPHGEDTLSMSYNTAGQLIRVSNGSGMISQVVYDERGHRIIQIDATGTITIFVSPDYQVQDTGGDQVVTKFLRDTIGPVASIVTTASGSNSSFFRRDTKGNITHVFNDSGAIVNTIVYDAFGMPIVTGTYRGPLYESRTWNDATGLYQFGARYYDPALGIFMTPDTKLGGSHHLQPGVWNRFSFELNDPICNIDPSGHFSWGAFLGAVTMAVIAVAGIAATVATGGASDALAADADAAIETADAGIEMTDMSADAASSASEAGGEAAEETGDLAAQGAKVTRSAIARQVVGNIVGGALTSGGISGFTYSVSAGDNFSWSQLGKQFGLAAAQGAVTGAFSAGGSFLSAVIAKRMISRIAVGAATDLLGNEAAYLTQCAITHQDPEPLQALKAAGMGLATGSLGGFMTDVRVQGIKNAVARSGANTSRYIRFCTFFAKTKEGAKDVIWDSQTIVAKGVMGLVGVVVVSGVTVLDMHEHGTV